ncbi:hypothetical protein EJ06DRAFT_363912 [Trichodelitschia bisporula]|uniref:SPRY domain-containing protein n=1 Tax=Trichodelitschia bisporula TaxID=703511 RepID=A0A6G1I149_9PEZI|nr:hypothetical protein EJ06DRAFT_363912 [Trichodelitschia bisporula]
MGLFSKLSKSNQGFAPPPGPPPSYGSQSSSQQYQSPPGPLPSQQYQPPPGPPPNQQYEPPPGPPPGLPEAPPPYHDWTVIPDTALLPPPPVLSHDYSPAANASEEDAVRAKQWCASNPIWGAQQLSWEQLNAIHTHRFTIIKSPYYVGDLLPDDPSPGIWKCRTWARCPDALLHTDLPLYSALADSPLATEVPKTIYFELKILGIGRNGTSNWKKSGILGHLAHHDESATIDAGIALGFFAPPYPPFRLPGWQRGSLGVHSDDGRRYVCDTDGGNDFTEPFRVGETLGLGMTFRVPHLPPEYGSTRRPLDVEVFFTRDGSRVGGWDLHEEKDVADSDIHGLEGESDMFAAVGVFGGVDFEVKFRELDWLYRPGMT